VRDRPIHPHEFWLKLVEAGLVSEDERITRLVLDVKLGEPVKLYIERLPDRKWLDVIPLLSEVQLITGPEERDE